MTTARTCASCAIAVSASPSAASIASDRLLRACGRFSVSMATAPMSSRSRISGGGGGGDGGGLGVHAASSGAVGGFAVARAFIVSDPRCRHGASGNDGRGMQRWTTGHGGAETDAQGARASSCAPNFPKCSMPTAASRSRRSGMAAAACGRPSSAPRCGPGGTHLGPDHDGAGRFRHVCRGAGRRSARCRSPSPPISTSISCASRRRAICSPSARLLKLGKRLAVGEVDDPLRGRGGAGRACHLDLFDPAARSALRW